MSQVEINQAFLGTEWKFWSRNVNNWNDPKNRNCQYYFDHVNRWLEVRLNGKQCRTDRDTKQITDGIFT